MTMIYLASPYSHKQKNIKSYRYYMTLEAVAMLSKNHPTWFIYSPIVHFHNVASDYDMPTDAAYWWNVNEIAMEKSSEIFVLTLPGWEESLGVRVEINWGLHHDKIIRLVDPETYHEKLYKTGTEFRLNGPTT